MYYVSFIDDFSRKTWIYFLRKKSEVFDRFKEFKALVENQTEKQIKVLRTDNGGEFCGNEFEEFCKKCGIARQKTTPYTPQQNGVAERMNRMLMEKARCMLRCRDRERILGRGSGYCMLSGQQITLISIG
jgi:transposase InsO family protein